MSRLQWLCTPLRSWVHAVWKLSVLQQAGESVLQEATLSQPTLQTPGVILHFCQVNEIKQVELHELAEIVLAQLQTRTA